MARAHRVALIATITTVAHLLLFFNILLGCQNDCWANFTCVSGTTSDILFYSNILLVSSPNGELEFWMHMVELLGPSTDPLVASCCGLVFQKHIRNGHWTLWFLPNFAISPISKLCPSAWLGPYFSTPPTSTTVHENWLRLISLSDRFF